MNFSKLHSRLGRSTQGRHWTLWLLLCLLSCLVGAAACTQTGDSSTCVEGLTSCNGACVSTSSDPLHCGACGTVCAAGTVCSLDACKAGCDVGLTQCGQACVDSASNPLHCGGCNIACGPGNICSAGVCQCPAGTVCDGSGTGGASGTGGGTGSGGAATGGGTGSGGGTAVDNGGYITSGTWHGYAWTAVSQSAGMDTATISPKDFGTVTQPPLCASGSVNAGDANVAMIGWNLQQDPTPEGGSPLPATGVTPLLDGIMVSVTNPGGSPLRLQIQGPNGATDGSDRWCAAIPGTGGFIAYSSFSTECWAGAMNPVPYNGEPIVAAIVLVPGKAASATPFDFCIDNIQESDADGPPPGTGCSLSGSAGTGGSTTPFGGSGESGRRLVTRDGRQYMVQNNVWNGDWSRQALTATGVSFTVSSQSNSSSTSGAPSSFPSVFIGSNWGASTSGSNLPRQVSAIAASSEGVPTGWKWTPVSSGVYNATYDVWFSTGAGGDAQAPSGAYLMVWFHSQNPGGARPQPLGSDKGVVTVAGRQWNVWTCDGACQDGVRVISYVPAGWATITEWSFNLKDFIGDATTRGVLQSSWYLSNVFAGFEIWSGGQGLRTDNFCAVVN